MAVRMLVYSVVDRLDPGGAQIVIARLLDSLRKRGHDVTEAWAGPGPKPHGRGIPETDGRDEWICPLHVRKADPAGRRRPYHIPSLMRLMAGLSLRRPRIVNIHFISEQTIYFLLLRRIFGYRVVLSVHGSDVMAPAPGWREHLPEFLRKADAVTVVSRVLADKVLAFPDVEPSKVHLIANGIDSDFWSPGDDSVRPAHRTPGHPTIVAVGRLEPVKGFDILIRALALLRRTVPDARLCLIGDGSQAGPLRELSAGLGLAEAVEFTGFLPPEAIRERLRSASAYALPSRSEGMPLALLEAMACGVPTVAARVGGVPEVITGESGLLVEPENDEDLADALGRLLQDGDFARMTGRSAHRRALDFTSAASDAAYERLYRTLAGP